MRKTLAIILTVICMSTVTASFAGASESELDMQVDVLAPEGLGDLADLLYDMEEGITVQELIDTASKNLKIIKAYKPFLEESAYDNINKALAGVKRSKTVAAADEFMQVWQDITQIKPLEGNVWYLWEEGNMPVLDGEELTEEDFEGTAIQDNIDYRPFVIKYLLDDPAQAKGNLLINAGGERSNDNEGYPVAELFNTLGYNCFIVNRRSLPFKYEDKAMDLQRAIRLVKYHAQEESWGGQDMIAAFGGSAGGIVILGCINELYGDRTPQVFDTDYVPDEIDMINSDLDAAVTLYFGGTKIETDEGVPDYAKPEFLLDEDNPNWPAMYLCSGIDDSFGADGTAQKIYDQIKDKVPAMLHLIEGGRHGFGLGMEDVLETFGWPYEADVFLQELKGR